MEKHTVWLVFFELFRGNPESLLLGVMSIIEVIETAFFWRITWTHISIGWSGSLFLDMFQIVCFSVLITVSLAFLHLLHQVLGQLLQWLKTSHQLFLFLGGRRTEESSMGRKYEKDQTAQWGEWPGEAWFHHGNECLWWHGDDDTYSITMLFSLQFIRVFCFSMIYVFFFSLKTLEEFRKVMIEIPVPTFKKGKSVQKRLSVNLPKFINWKKRGYVTPVRTQVWQYHVPILLSH